MKKNLRQRTDFALKLGFAKADAKILARLSSPQKIQDFISSLGKNRERSGDTCLSAVRVMARGTAHCIEAAFVAGAALWINGYPPLLMDMQAKGDKDHVIAVFKHKGHWGAISKSNHVWLRWRDPVYKTPRELAMSYFHEYTNKKKKTLRAYSAPVDMRKMPDRRWINASDDCWDVEAALDNARHFNLITKAQAKILRPRDAMEMRADKMVQYT